MPRALLGSDNVVNISKINAVLEKYLREKCLSQVVKEHSFQYIFCFAAFLLRYFHPFQIS